MTNPRAGEVSLRSSGPLLAGDGVLAGRIPTQLDPVVAAGYQHLDVLMAAAQQNDGHPEPISTALAAFADSP